MPDQTAMRQVLGEQQYTATQRRPHGTQVTFRDAAGEPVADIYGLTPEQTLARSGLFSKAPEMARLLERIRDDKPPVGGHCAWCWGYEEHRVGCLWAETVALLASLNLGVEG